MELFCSIDEAVQNGSELARMQVAGGCVSGISRFGAR